MRKIVKEFNVYKYEELSEEAKQKVRNDFLEDFHTPEEILNIWQDEIRPLFYGNEFNVQFSLNYCQGDGVNIYGKTSIYFILKYMGFEYPELYKKFTDKEIKTLLHYDVFYLHFPSNLRYNYCYINEADLCTEIICELRLRNFKNINYNVIHKFWNLTREMVKLICKNFEERGYEYFEKIDEEEIYDICYLNNYEFYENGEIYNS